MMELSLNMASPERSATSCFKQTLCDDDVMDVNAAIPTQTSSNQSHQFISPPAIQPIPSFTSTPSSGTSYTPSKHGMQTLSLMDLQHHTPQTRTLFKTPSSGRSSNSRISTFRTPSSGGSRLLTPQSETPNKIVNPFDQHLLENLQSHVFSPGVFQNKTNKNSPEGFHWAIEHLAILQPAEIEELPIKQELYSRARANKDLEEQAQKAIDSFFSSNLVAPSPSTCSSKKKKHVLPSTPQTPASLDDLYSPVKGSPALSEETENRNNNKNNRVEKSISGTSEASTQTMLSLPVDLDLHKILGDYYIQNLTDENGVGDISTSSLRRKLFFQGDPGEPLSPVRISDSMDFDISPPVSPVKHSNYAHYRQSPFDKRGSSHFSSSPINGSRHEPMSSPILRRCSTAPELMASLEMSPISPSLESCGRHVSKKSRDLLTPVDGRLEGTPSSGRPSNCIGSPDISPIKQFDGSYMDLPRSQVVYCQSNSSNGSLENKDHQSLEESICQIISAERISSNSPKQSISCDNNSTSGQATHGTLGSPTEEISQEVAKVMFSASDCASESQVTESLIPPNTLTFSQDTGYQTNSLQMTNSHDTGIIHGDVGMQSAFINSHNTDSELMQITADQDILSIKSQVKHTDLTNQMLHLPQLLNHDSHTDSNNSFQKQYDERKMQENMDSRNHQSTPVLPWKPFKTHTLWTEKEFNESELVVEKARQVLSRLDNHNALDTHMRHDIGQKHHCPFTLHHQVSEGEQTLPDASQSLATMTTPQREIFRDLGVIGEDTCSRPLRASQMASHVIQRAEEDYARYCLSENSNLDQLYFNH